MVARGGGDSPPSPPRNSSSSSGGKEKPPDRPFSLAPISEPNGRAKNGLEPAARGAMPEQGPAIDLARKMSRIHAAHVEGHFGAVASHTLLFAAVYLGMFEKRLMNASKL